MKKNSKFVKVYFSDVLSRETYCNYQREWGYYDKENIDINHILDDMIRMKTHVVKITDKEFAKKVKEDVTKTFRNIIGEDFISIVKLYTAFKINLIKDNFFTNNEKKCSFDSFDDIDFNHLYPSIIVYNDSEFDKAIDGILYTTDMRGSANQFIIGDKYDTKYIIALYWLYQCVINY